MVLRNFFTGQRSRNAVWAGIYYGNWEVGFEEIIGGRDPRFASINAQRRQSVKDETDITNKGSLR